MAMESQGIVISRGATNPTTLTTTVDVQSTLLVLGSSWSSQGYSTGMYIQLSGVDTALKRVKSISDTTLNIFGSYGDTGSTSLQVSGYTMTGLGEITGFTGPGGAAAVIDITHFLSTGKEKLIGIRDEGEISLTLNYVATDSGQDLLKADRAARQRSLYTIQFTDITTGSSAFPSWCYFNGYCKNFSISGAVDDKVSANAAIEIDGAVVYSTKVTAG